MAALRGAKVKAKRGRAASFMVAMLIVGGSLLGTLILSTAQLASASTTLPKLAPTAVPPGIRFYVPINITNTVATATPSPFQDKIIIDSSSYFYYEAPHLQNIEFFASDGTIIPSWLERGGRNYTTTAYWLKLANGIGANSHITVYMGFANTTSTLFNTRTTGEAPTLSPVYGQYDDGAHVFEFYDNFNGTTLDSNWVQVSNPGATGAVGVSNGLTVSGSNDWYGVVQSNATYSPQKWVTDFDGYFSSLAGPDTNEFGWNYPTSPRLYSLYAINNYGGEYSLVNSNGRTSSQVQIATGNTSSPEIMSIWATIQDSSASLNYTHLTTNSASFAGVVFNRLASYANSGSQFLQWVRLRAIPPIPTGSRDPVMPSSAVAGPIIYVSSTTVSCVPGVAVLGSGSACTVFVHGVSPSGNITWTATGSGKFSLPWCILKFNATKFFCVVSFTPTSLGTTTLKASFPGDNKNFMSSGTISLVVVRSGSTTQVSCSPKSVPLGVSTTCTATVGGYSPSGTVSWTSRQGGSFSPTPSCTLSGGACSVKFTPTTTAPSVSVIGNYTGDSNNAGSSGSFAVILGTTTTTSLTTTTTTTETRSTSQSSTQASTTSSTQSIQTSNTHTLTITYSTPYVTSTAVPAGPTFNYTPYLYGAGIIVLLGAAYLALSRVRRRRAATF